MTNQLQRDVDLSTCDREPIHVPGSIQPHGVLLILDESTRKITHASLNSAEWFGHDAGSLLGQDLAFLFGQEAVNVLEDSIQSDRLGTTPQFLTYLTLASQPNSPRFDALIHRGEGVLILEIEQSEDGGSNLLNGLDFNHLSRDILTRFDKVGTVEELCGLAAAEIRRLIGFDRALVYRFDEDWNGTVIAEDRNETLPSYMALRFPASDIPAQARELYRQSRLRLIADARYKPVRIHPASDSQSDQPIDLRFSVLRSVSPAHVEYMVNMGTAASLSISILRDGQLWGLIACHNRDAKLVRYRDRFACDFLGQVISIQLAAKDQRRDYDQRIARKATQSRLLEVMTHSEDFVSGLLNGGSDLMSLTDSTGAAILHEGQTWLVGITPHADDVERIADWLFREGRDDVVVRDSLVADIPIASDFKDEASGLLSISISKLHRSFILWFRPEVIRSVAWGGDPSKAIVAEEDGRIHPRRSFETWLETVRHCSTPWQASEIEAATEFRNTIVGIVLRHAEERAQFSNELERSNKELEAFSYSVSHDLRAPFRHIVGYSDMLREEEGDRLSSEGKRYLNTIIDSAQNAGNLVDNLLAFSRMGRTTIHPVPIDMNILIREVVQEAMMEAGSRSVTWKIGVLPRIEGDLMMMRMAVGNLASNAVKYTRNRPEAVIEINAEAKGEETVFSVRDNGVGFDMRYVDKLFGVFQRLHRQEDFEGTGIGLANVRRIMGRHGGKAWGEGVLNEGATFYFSLPKERAEANGSGSQG